MLVAPGAPLERAAAAAVARCPPAGGRRSRPDAPWPTTLVRREALRDSPSRRSIAVVLTDGRVRRRRRRARAPPRRWAAAADAVQVIDTEDGPVRLGRAGAIAAAAGGDVHALVPITFAPRRAA